MAINIFGVVGEEVRAADIIAKIHAEKSDVLNVNIMSIGGDVREGLAIYDALRDAAANGQEVKTFALGMTASIASIIFMAGDVREVSDNAEIMIHNASVNLYGNKHELKGAIEFLDDIDDKLINIYKDRTTLSTDEISNLLDQETFMTADEAVNKGFATEKANALELVAQYNDSINKQKEPAKMAKETKETGFFAHMKAYFNSDVKAMEEDEEVKAMEEGEEIPEKEDDAAEEAKAEGDDMPPESMEEEESEEVKALKAELEEANNKLAAAEAKAEGDSEEITEEVEAKASLVFNAMTDDKVTMHEAKTLLSKPLADVKAALSDKESNASGRAKGQQPKADPKAGNKFEEYQAIEDPSKRKAFFALNKQAIINGNKESI
jgi:ATP-dependent Clp protease protease subunit